MPRASVVKKRNIVRVENLVANIRDYGAMGDGGDAVAAIMAFTADYQGKSVELLIPHGTYTLNGRQSPNGMFGGIARLKVMAYGAEFSSSSEYYGPSRWIIQKNGTASTASIASA